MKFFANGKKTISLLAVLAVGLLMTDIASAADIFDRLSAINSKLPVVKTTIIYVFFIGGLVALGAGVWDMIKLAKPENRGEIKWSMVLIKCVAGVLLIGLTLSSDTMQQTIFGTTTSAPSNVSMLVPSKSELA